MPAFTYNNYMVRPRVLVSRSSDDDCLTAAVRRRMTTVYAAALCHLSQGLHMGAVLRLSDDDCCYQHDGGLLKLTRGVVQTRTQLPK